ncbi:MAG: 3-oxoacyl-[acyl-carrier-protein] reductase FabG [Alphaproteobacteria bacterium MarineAlpha9_Bin4]|nr:hypothetical protein [Pelagibacterales bacterium]PPR24438.1 MAG: 3-oxoacyl-[acyl-carrier-protein] reductase FabG [Alphaproteobacteria bacterium MarineAlpha9_Bin4]|tara:strand:+ start:221 stop:922 length:702 start_codon:yes stop_codon:yes gene_type:complete
MKDRMKKYLITGTSKGIGKSIALKLIKNKCLVLGISRKHSIKAKNYIPFSQDISDLEGFTKTLEYIKNKHPDIQGVISNAGEGVFNKLENFSDIQISNYFNLNLLSHILLAKKMISNLKKSRKGIFIFIGSEATKIGGIQGTLYCSAKHGLLGFFKSFKAEANKASVRATIINPGMVRTSFFKNLKFSPGSDRENAIEAEDIAELVYFLCNSSKYINYSDINIDPLKKVIIKK